MQKIKDIPLELLDCYRRHIGPFRNGLVIRESKPGTATVFSANRVRLSDAQEYLRGLEEAIAGEVGIAEEREIPLKTENIQPIQGYIYDGEPFPASAPKGKSEPMIVDSTGITSIPVMSINPNKEGGRYQIGEGGRYQIGGSYISANPMVYDKIEYKKTESKKTLGDYPPNERRGRVFVYNGMTYCYESKWSDGIWASDKLNKRVSLLLTEEEVEQLEVRRS